MNNSVFKKFKTIVCDYDGTLIGADLIVSEVVKKAVKSLEDNNIKFLIASGRSYFGLIEQTCNELNLKTPQITRGGAEIIDASNGEILFSEIIPNDSLNELINTLRSLDINFAVEKGNFVYTRDSKPIWGYGKVGPIPFKLIDEIEVIDIPKVIVFPIQNQNTEEKFEKIVHKDFSNLFITRSFSPVGKTWDITSSMANKQEAVLRVSRLLNTSPKEMIGIGDGHNDIPLLQICGYKVAMGNAHQELKDIADEIILSQPEDGVAIFINNFLRKIKD